MGVGAAIGQACLLLSAGTKGKRFMMPHAKGNNAVASSNLQLLFLRFFIPTNFVSAMIQQPRVPSSGLMPASDVLIRAKEVIFCPLSYIFKKKLSCCFMNYNSGMD